MVEGELHFTGHQNQALVDAGSGDVVEVIAPARSPNFGNNKAELALFAAEVAPLEAEEAIPMASPNTNPIPSPMANPEGRKKKNPSGMDMEAHQPGVLASPPNPNTNPIPSPMASPKGRKKKNPSGMDMEAHQPGVLASPPKDSFPMAMSSSYGDTGVSTGDVSAGTGTGVPSPLLPHSGGSAVKLEEPVLLPASSQEILQAGHQQHCSTTESDLLDLEINESEIKASKNNNKGSKEEAPISTWNCRRIMIRLLIVLLIAGAGVGIAMWITSDSDENAATSNKILDITQVKPGTVAAQVPENLCNEWVPGQGKSEVCSVLASSRRGGQVANLVATSFQQETAVGADIAIINAGLVLKDIVAPEATVEDIMAILQDDQLVVVAMSGASIRRVLEEAIESALGEESPLASAYPYGGALRFSVDATKTFGFRVSGIQVLVTLDEALGNHFINIQEGGYYTVVTTSFLAGGGNGYKAFGAIVDAWKTELPQNTINTFYTHVKNMGELTFDVEYSTVSFVGPNYDPGLAVVPTNVCLAWVPGAGKSEMCTAEETSVQGGGVCNLVAWTFLDQNFRAEIALVRAGDYASDILQGTFKASDSKAIFPVDHPLVTIEVNGKKLIDILEATLGGALDVADPRPEAYPYAAGLRFDVNAAAGFGSRTSNIEFFQNTRWAPLEEDRVYTVVTTENLANGDDPAYLGFLYVDRDSLRTGKLSAVETFIAFATDWAVLFDPPREKYSTQVYDSAV
jgi:2',3'-cyclic-nucleotide 2'-phosphodiesterase (5'-nucleotidase family)